jgi:hypothetical protein
VRSAGVPRFTCSDPACIEPRCSRSGWSSSPPSSATARATRPARDRFSVPWRAIEAAWRQSTRGVEELYIRLDDPSRLQGSGIVKKLAGFSRRFLGAEVALPLSQLQADPDAVEEADQQAVARQSFWLKSSEQELMQ